MDYTRDLDSLIEKYKIELENLAEKYGYVADEQTENGTAEAEVQAQQHYSENTADTSREKDEEFSGEDYGSGGNLYTRQETSVMPEEIPEEKQESDEEKQISPYPLENPENYATFKAVIFTAEGALPVEGAKVSVKRRDELHAFLITNGSGETETVKLESFPEENSLQPLNPDKQMLYTADIKAEGFEDKTNLPVYATGGSQIILQEYLVPVGGM